MTGMRSGNHEDAKPAAGESKPLSTMVTQPGSGRRESAPSCRAPCPLGHSSQAPAEHFETRACQPLCRSFTSASIVAERSGLGNVDTATSGQTAAKGDEITHKTAVPMSKRPGGQDAVKTVSGVRDYAYRLRLRTSTPAPTIAMPIHSLTEGRSCRNAKANTATSSRLSLSTGATFDASPTFNALK